MEEFFTLPFWIAVIQIILVDLVLAGDNAMAIALACRPLPSHQRKLGIRWGVGVAIALRILMTIGIAYLLNLPLVHVIGGGLLLWIGIKLLRKKDEEEHALPTKSATNLWSAIYIIVTADVIMSLDNMIAVAGAARGNTFLLIFGLLISIPIMLWMSQILLKWITRYPIIEYLGAGLLGWIGGGLIANEIVFHPFWGKVSNFGVLLFSTLGALLVLSAGWDTRFFKRNVKNHI